MAPADAGSVAYTNWTQLRADAGLSDLSSRAPLDARLAFLSSLARERAAASGFGLAQFRLVAETWGWDSTDLDWELTVALPSGPPVYILRFRPGFDLAPYVARLEDRGFVRSAVGGVPVYSHAPDLTADWLIGLLALTNVAVLADDGTLIASAAPEGIAAVLATRAGDVRSLADDPVVANLGVLGSPEAAWVIPGEDACERVAPTPSAPPSASPGFQGRYGALAVIYRATPDGPVGQFAFAHPSPAAAAADLPAREAAARSGVSARTGQPYAEGIFVVESASVVGSTAVLGVRPFGSIPSRLFRMLTARDLAFAACGPG